MLINDILIPRSPTNEFSIVAEYCSDFINESEGFPLVKNLPISYNNVHRVKVRLHKKKTEVTETFNQAFNDEITNFRQRAIFASSSLQNINEKQNTEMFYVFPKDGYKFLYNKEISNSNKDYKQAFDTILEQLGDNNEAIQVIADLLKYTYTSKHLTEGIQSGSEIILYNIPFYYAVRTSLFPDYEDLLTSLQ
jgi:hypothetical protein